MSRKRIPKNPEHRRAWINYQLRLVGSSISAIAREHGVSRQAVWIALEIPSPKWEEIIAGKIGRRADEIWPERYLKAA
jgi:lambda repressor-like predicted transcriptional regulator